MATLCRQLFFALFTCLTLSSCFSPSVQTAASPGNRDVNILSWSPGDSFRKIKQEIRDARLRPIKYSARAFILVAPVLKDIYEAQRSLVEFDGKRRLTTLNVRVLPEPGSSGSDILRLYNDVKDSLIGKLGPPTWELQSGQAGRPEDILIALSNGDLLRSVQWEGSRNIRMGIPPRVDGEVAIEILITKHPIRRSTTFWGGKPF